MNENPNTHFLLFVCFKGDRDLHHHAQIDLNQIQSYKIMVHNLVLPELCVGGNRDEHGEYPPPPYKDVREYDKLNQTRSS